MAVLQVRLPEVLRYTVPNSRSRCTEGYAADYETLGTLSLKLGWDERDTSRQWVGVRRSRHACSYTCMSISRWQARF